MAENIIKFPKQKLAHPPQNEEEGNLMLLTLRSKHIDNIVGNVTFDVMRDLTYLGYDLSEFEVQRTLTLGFESIRAAMLQTIGASHPLQKVAAEVIKIEQMSSVSESLEEDEDDNEE